MQKDTAYRAVVVSDHWRAGASQPSRTSGSDFSIYIYIYILYIYIYIYIYIGILGECMALLASGSDPTA